MTMLGILLSNVGVGVLCLGLAPNGQQSATVPLTVAEFTTASLGRKLQELENVSRLKVPASPELLGVALDDPAPEVKASALALVGGLSAAGIDLTSLRDRVERLLPNDSPEVRKGAVNSIANLDIRSGYKSGENQRRQPNQPPRQPRISSQLASRLAQMYDEETDPRVRTELVRTMAVTATGDAKAPFRRVWLDALRLESTAATLQYAVRGLAQIREVSALPQIAKLLGSPERSVRLAATVAMSQLTPESKKFLPQVQAASIREQDANVRNAMLNLITQLER